MRSEMYDTVCKERFTTLTAEVTEVRKDTQYLRAKIDNGLSALPKKMNALMLVFGTLVIAIVAGVGVWTFHLGQLEGKLNAHVIQSERMITEVLEEVRRSEE